VISAFIKKENMVNLGAGIFLFVMTLGLASMLNLNPVRLSMFENLISSNSSYGSGFGMGSRADNWAVYYKDIIDKPIFGNGFKTLSGQNETKQGVHNTFLMILGEAGIVPFLIFIFITINLLVNSLNRLRSSPKYFYLSIVLVSIFFVSHVFFNNYIILFTLLWLYDRLNNYKEEKILNSTQS
jgi:O-antigen ligase